MNAPNQYGVAVGQRWRDMDKRSVGRIVEVIAVDAFFATVGPPAMLAVATLRSRIRLDRFKPSLWQRIEGAPAQEPTR